MRIACFCAENTASSWYRCYFWAHEMTKRGHDLFIDYNVDTLDVNHFDRMVRDVDVVICGRTNSARFIAAALAGRDLYKYKLIIDTDDLVSELHEHHVSRTSFHNATGVTRMAYAQYRMADAVTVSTRNLLQDTIKHNPRTYLVPNHASTDMWASVKRRQKELRHRGDIRIYFGGGSGHYGDLMLVKDALIKLVNEDTRVKLVFQNFMPDWAVNLPRTFYVPFVEFPSYAKILTWLCPDIAIAPLDDNTHNLCKSDVKYLDYGLSGAAGVYQRLEPYSSVEDGVTGLLASTPDEWYAQLKRLVDDADLRRSIAEHSRADILGRRTVAHFADRYEAMLNEVVGAKKPQPAEMHMLQEGKPLEITQWAQS